MLAEIGQFALIIAFCFALSQGILPLLRGKQTAHFRQLGTQAAIGQLVFLSIAMLSLIGCFMLNDLTVVYVRERSHRLLPFLYRIGASWGGHEGSLVLWCLILSAWTTAVIIFCKQLSQTTHTYVVMVLGWISSGFLLFILATSNPFIRNFPNQPISGNDLTPILQDPGLLFHPPMLYLGYVGFAISFAFAVTALIEGKLDKTWIHACKPWVILSWSFLSFGIVLGSWWSYRELGWGGWWFWDPVENASLLPWLAGTALLHSLIVSEKREAFKGWTILLSIIAFTLSLLGTFLVRSGVLVSVHAFASDPTRGIYLLIYLAVIIILALCLYAYRIKHLYNIHDFKVLSKESFLLINSVFMVVAVATIVLGTLYPILLDALNLDKISVGEPYFNTVFMPIMLPLLLMMGLAPHVNWHSHSAKTLWQKLRWELLISLTLAIALPWLLADSIKLAACIGLFIGLWIISATLKYAWRSYQMKSQLTYRQWAMIIAHIGIAILAIGIGLNKSYSQEKQVKLAAGETTQLAGYTFTFDNIREAAGSNYTSAIGHFTVARAQKPFTHIDAELRLFKSHHEVMSKTGISINPWRDLYIALGNPISQTEWMMRLYYKPFVRWIWLGGILLLIGGLLTLIPQKREHSHG